MRDEGYYRAKRIARAKKKLRIHVIVVIAIVVFLGLLNAMTSGYPWFQWPTMAMGLGLMVHAVSVYAKEHVEEYEKKTLNKELKKYGREGDYLDLETTEDQLELDELPELREEWKDSDFV